MAKPPWNKTYRKCSASKCHAPGPESGVKGSMEVFVSPVLAPLNPPSLCQGGVASEGLPLALKLSAALAGFDNHVGKLLHFRCSSNIIEDGERFEILWHAAW